MVVKSRNRSWDQEAWNRKDWLVFPLVISYTVVFWSSDGPWTHMCSHASPQKLRLKIASVLVTQSCPTFCKPTRLLCLWNFLGKKTAMGSRSPSPGDLPDPGMESGSQALQILYCLNHQRSPQDPKWCYLNLNPEKSFANYLTLDWFPV